jgi:hypothetical protein
MTIYHECLRKSAIIYERTGILVGHDEISLLCELWGCLNAGDFYSKMNSITDEELKSWVEKVKKKRKILEHYLFQEQQKIYA